MPHLAPYYVETWKALYECGRVLVIKSNKIGLSTSAAREGIAIPEHRVNRDLAFTNATVIKKVTSIVATLQS